MRKIKLLLVLPLVIFMSCDQDVPENNVGAWYVKNNTDKTLRIVTYGQVGQQTKEQRIWLYSNDSTYVHISVREVGSGRLPQFKDLIDLDSLYICDKDEIVLRKYLQKNKDVEDRNIFREDMWQYYEDHRGFYYRPICDYLRFIWVCNINEDDLQLKK